MAKPKLGIESAKFSDGDWTFRDRHPFWAGCDERPELFEEPMTPRERAFKEKAELAQIEQATARMAQDLADHQRKAAADPVLQERMQQAREAALGSAKNAKQRKEMEEGFDMMQKLMGAGSLEEMLNAVGMPAEEEEDDFDDEPDPEEAQDIAEGWAEVIFTGGTKKNGFSPAQRAAYEHYLQHEKAIGPTVLKALFEYYREVRPRYVETFGEECCPAIKSAEDLRNLVRYRTLFVHPPDAKGICELGFSFSSTWEAEHGVGVRVRAGEMIDVGYSDVAFEEELEPQGDGDEDDE